MIHVDRTQWPVGHGCFHTSKITTQKATYNIVYDCGGKKAQLHKSIGHYLRSLGTRKFVDALFISHFHADHVGHVDHLLRQLGPNNLGDLYIPYLKERDALLYIASMETAPTAATLQAILSPEEWAEGKAQRVILVQPALGPDEGDVGLPTGPGEGGFDILGEGELRATIRDAQGAIFQPDTKTLELPQNGTITLGGNMHQVLWVLKPYVTPFMVKGTQIDPTKFRSEVQDLVKADPHSNTLAGYLSQNGNWSKIKALYETHIGKNINRTSMSLYSGLPLGMKVECYYDSHPHSHHSHHLLSEHHIWFRRHRFKAEYYPVGWIGTGDSDLKTPFVRGDWIRAYQSAFSLTGTFMPPHHGSSGNHCDDVYKAVRPLLTVISDSCTSKRAPYALLRKISRRIGFSIIKTCEHSNRPFTEQIAVLLK